MPETEGELTQGEQELARRLGLVARALGGFEPGDSQGAWPGPWRGGARFRVEPADIPVPGLALWVLTQALHAPNLGRQEKLAWEVRFLFDGFRCALAHQKFGVYLYVEETAADPQALSARIVGRLKKTIAVAERLVFRPFADAQLARGNITVRNQFYLLNTMYHHFRELCMADQPPDVDQPLDGGSTAEASDPPRLLTQLADTWNRNVEANHNRFFYAVAMVNAYFSLLEHTLVLIWPSMNYVPGTDDVKAFIGHYWREKFKIVFDVSADQHAARLYSRLCDAAEEYRNPYAHGGFDKAGAAIGVHVPGLGAIPANLTDIRNSRHFRFLPFDEAGVGTLVALFDEVDQWLRTGPAALGMQFIEYGLDVTFDAESVLDQRAEMARDPDGYLQALAHYIDNVTNMDW